MADRVEESLQSFMDSDDTGRRDVIVSVKSTRPVMRSALLARHGMRVSVPALQDRAVEEVAAARFRAAQLRQHITDITGDEPVWLDAANAFVVSAAADELRRIAASPLVDSVSSNHRLS